MANVKYLVTVDSETGAATKLERVGESGDLKEIDLSKLFLDIGGFGGTTIVVNIYGGGAGVIPSGAVVSPKGAVKLTDGDELNIGFHIPGPPGPRGR